MRDENRRLLCDILILWSAAFCCCNSETEARKAVEEAGGRREVPDAPGASADARAIVFFYDPGCPDCEIVKKDLLPILLAQRNLGWDDVEYVGVDGSAGRSRLMKLENQLHFKAADLAPVIVVGGLALCGVKAVQGEIEGAGR